MKRSLISIALLIVFAGVTQAAAVKIDLGHSAQPFDPDASGRVMLNYAKDVDETQIQVNCADLTPGETYRVCVYIKGQTSDEYICVDTVVGLPNGRLTLHGWLPGDWLALEKLVLGVYRRTNDPYNPWIAILGAFF